MREPAPSRALVEKRLGKRGFTDLFWPDVLLVEQKSAGRNLDEAYDQAGDYFDGMNGGPIAFQGFPPIRRSGEEATNRLRDEVRAVAPAKKQPFSMR